MEKMMKKLFLVLVMLISGSALSVSAATPNTGLILCPTLEVIG